MILNFMNNYPKKILNQTNKNIKIFLYKLKKLINYSIPKLILSINEGYIFWILFF